MSAKWLRCDPELVDYGRKLNANELETKWSRIKAEPLGYLRHHIHSTWVIPWRVNSSSKVESGWQSRSQKNIDFHCKTLCYYNYLFYYYQTTSILLMLFKVPKISVCFGSALATCNFFLAVIIMKSSKKQTLICSLLQKSCNPELCIRDSVISTRFQHF